MEEETSHAATHLTPDPLAVAEASPLDEEGRARRASRTLALDLTPLRRSREFRLLFAGQAVSFFGSMMTMVAVPWQVYQITKSSFAVGMLGVAEFAPIFVMAFIGGALADAVDRRRMVRITEALIAALTAVLILNSLLAQPRVWVLYSAAVLFAALNALQRPSLDALMPRLVAPEQMPAAMALRSLSGTVCMIGGPALGGLLVVAFGAMCVTLTSGWSKRVNRHGLCVALAAASWGLAIVGFGFAQTLWAALLCLALAGASDMVSGLFRSIIWNQTIPDRLRGRLAGIEMVSYTTGPLLGNAESGVVAGLFGVRASIVSGGVLC